MKRSQDEINTPFHWASYFEWIEVMGVLARLLDVDEINFECTYVCLVCLARLFVRHCARGINRGIVSIGHARADTSTSYAHSIGRAPT